MNKTQIEFIQHSFIPTCELSIDSNNHIVNATSNFGELFMISEFVGLSISEAFELNDKNSRQFIEDFNNAIRHSTTSLLAINSYIHTKRYISVPAIYLLLMIVEHDGNKNKVIKLYNMIKLTRLVQSLFSGAVLPSMLNLTDKLKNNIKSKSLYFAYEALKSFGHFIPNVSYVQPNFYIGELVHNFHSYRNSTPNKLFKQRLAKDGGYVDMAKQRTQRLLHKNVIDDLTQKDLIAFNEIHENMIISVI